MYLIYIDESGDTGLKLSDPQQPVFLMAALAMEKRQWFDIEREFLTVVKDFNGGEIPDDFELHAMDMVSRRRSFKSFSKAQTIEFRDAIFKLTEKYFSNKIFYISIDKKRFGQFCLERYGEGVRIQPYIMALPFICMNVDCFLKKNRKHGILIFDEKREGVADAEQALKVLRLDRNSSLNTSSLIEKGFFVDSQKSYPLQIIDMIAYYLRKFEEFKLGFQVSPVHRQVFKSIEEFTTNIKDDIQGFTDYSNFIEKYFLRYKK